MGLFEYLFSKTENIIAKMHEIEWIDNEQRRISYAICNDTTKMNDWISDSVNQNSLSYINFFERITFLCSMLREMHFSDQCFRFEIDVIDSTKTNTSLLFKRRKIYRMTIPIEKESIFCRNFKALYQAAPPTIFFYLSKTFTLSSIEN